MIYDENLWKALETAVILKINDLKDRQLYDVLSSFSKYKNTSDKLWKELEKVIVNNFCPKHNMQAVIVGQIISTFNKINLLNQNFLQVLEQQVLRVYLNFDGTDTSRILNIYTMSEIGSDELMKNLCKQAKLSLPTMDWHSATVSLVCFIKLGRGDQVEPFENYLTLMFPRLSLYHISIIFFTYSKCIPIPLKNNTERRKFIMSLCEFLETKRELITQEENSRNLLYVMHGMAIGK